MSKMYINMVYEKEKEKKKNQSDNIIKSMWNK